MATAKVTLARRAGYTPRDKEVEGKHDNKARQRPHQPRPCCTVAEWGQQGKTLNSSQIQARIQMTRQAGRDEVGLKSSREVRAGDSGNQNQTSARQAHSDAVYSRAEIKVETQSLGQGLDQQSVEKSDCNRAGDRHGYNIIITGKD